MIKLVIYGEPVAQGRPRLNPYGKKKAYDPPKSKNYKEYVKYAAASQMGGKPPLCGCLSLSIRVYRSIPKSFSKKNKKLAIESAIRPQTRPDLDNYVKGIKDALNSICWEDDSQIVSYKEPFGKYYSDTPRIEVEIYEMQ